MSNPNTAKAWEGLGGPVTLDKYHFDGIDPTLDSCCQREIESNRKYNALTSSLSRHDVTLLAERRRRHVLHNLAFGSGCRCSYDPNADGGEYRALIELRKESHLGLVDGDEQKGEPDLEDDRRIDKRNSEADEEDSDDEFDYLLDEDLPIDSDLEERRRAELEFIMLSQEIALHHGYGAHRQMHPNRALRAAGLGVARDPTPAVVLHLFDGNSRVSASLDLYLETLATEFKGTKFIRSSGRSTLLMDAELAAKTLPTLKPDSDIPALIAIRNGEVIATSVRLQGLTDHHTDDILTHAVRDWLEHAHVLLTAPPALDALCRIRPEEDALLDNMRVGTQNVQPRYDCGIPTCCKPFFHEHVGIATEAQDGFLVSEETILGSEEGATGNL